MNMMIWGQGNGVMMAFYWILITIAIGAFIRFLTRPKDTYSRGDSAIELLGNRLARGDMTQEEYEEIKRILLRIRGNTI